MSSHVVEEFLVRIGIDPSAYQRELDKFIASNEKLNDVLEQTENSFDKTTKKSKENAKETKSTTTEVDKMAIAFSGAIGSVVRFFGLIATSKAISNLANDIAKSNDKVNFLSKNIGTSSKELYAWSGAAEAMGGSSEAMQSDLLNLKNSLNEFAVAGDASLLPFFNNLGVSMLDTSLKARDAEKVMLDLADVLSRRDRSEAYMIAQKMGISDSSFNVLVQGRKAMEAQISYQRTMYRSGVQELKNSRQYLNTQSKIASQWNSIMTMIGDKVIPKLEELQKKILGFFEYLQKHPEEVEKAMVAVAAVITAVAIPAVAKLTLAFGPLALAIAGLSAGFMYLYDDYKKYSSKMESDIDWGWWIDHFKDLGLTIENFSATFNIHFKTVKSILSDAQNAFSDMFIALLDYSESESWQKIKANFTNLNSSITQWGKETSEWFARGQKDLSAWIGSIQDFLEVNDTFGKKIKAFADWSGLTAGVNRFKNAFVDLSNSIKSSVMPAFEWLSAAMDAILDRRFSDAIGIISGGQEKYATDKANAENWNKNLEVRASVKMGKPEEVAREREAFDFFVNQGWTKEQAAGLVANLSAESNFNHQAVGDGGEAYGIGQWHPDRQARFKKHMGYDIRESTYKQQLIFMQLELENEEKDAANNIRKEKTAQGAGYRVSRAYFRPGKKEEAKEKNAKYRAGMADVMRIRHGKSDREDLITPSNEEARLQGIDINAMMRNLITPSLPTPTSTINNRNFDMKIQNVTVNTTASSISDIASAVASSTESRMMANQLIN